MLLLAMAAALHAQPATGLPAGVRAVWDLEKAHREATATRERISINGLWRWQPADPGGDRVPLGGWGYFKVPGCWPGITDYMQKDCQTLYPHPGWQDRRLREIDAAWYEREICVPRSWEGRRIALHAEYLDSWAAVYLDRRKIGEMRWPAGELDLGIAARPGRTYVLSILVRALPLQAVMDPQGAVGDARAADGKIARRGLCGDLQLIATPKKARLGDIAVTTSVRAGEVGIDADVEDLRPGASHRLRARILEGGDVVREFTSPRFTPKQLQRGRFAFSAPWKPGRHWDLHTPENTFELDLCLLDSSGELLDQACPVRFGFREFWIEGRDFFLNGTRIGLSAVPLDNAQAGAAWASYAGARESLLRLKSFGINAVYTHNYGCEPGSHLSFAEILQAADDVGMLVSLSQPHFARYDWKSEDAEQSNGYARHAAFYARVAGNHPSVVLYSMSHNATGYSEDMNPDRIDGRDDRRSEGSRRNADRALRAEAIVRRIDPSRVVYHHSSGNLGSMHTINFYPNFVPIQEMSDWFEHWATDGVKPLFTCEFAAPFSWDWAMYRGWYAGHRSFGSAVVPWDFCLAEWNAQFLGDAAFRISEEEKRNLRWEARQLRAGKLWHRWDYPHRLGSRDFDERYPVLAAYLSDNWRAFRTWGVSAISPWEHHLFWKIRPGVARHRRVDLPVDWESLQRPGFSPDYLEERYERMDLAYERSDWIDTPAAEAMYRNNRPLLGWIAGPAEEVTAKGHLFRAGETVRKQIILINGSRQPLTCACSWAWSVAGAPGGSRSVNIEAGQQSRIPVEWSLPEIEPGAYALEAEMRFSTGEVQTDRFAFHVLGPLPERPIRARRRTRWALFDPQGETTRLLAAAGVRGRGIDARAGLSGYDVLVIGRSALTVEGPAPDLSRVPKGLRVLVFEQSVEVLEQRLGFRVAAYGLRRVFRRVPDHPVLATLGEEHLRDWRGSATLLPPRLRYDESDRYAGAPVVRWCGLEVPRLWRAGNRGCVASVLIEKPARGDFLPVVDGGFSLQYSPLLEYREGEGLILFCQMDVTGRSAEDPAASRLVRNLLDYVADPRTASGVTPAPSRSVCYVGEPEGGAHLEAAGLSPRSYEDDELSPDEVLVVGAGGGAALRKDAARVKRWLEGGGQLLALELDGEELDAVLPAPVRTARQEHIATFFATPGLGSPFAGVGPADVHNRDPRDLPLVTGGADILGDGVLACMADARFLFFQLAPHHVLRGGGEQPNVRKTYRRAAFALNRVLANLGVRGRCPLLEHFASPPSTIRGASVLKDGDFAEDADRDGWPDQWQISGEAESPTSRLERSERIAGHRVLRIAGTAGGDDSVMLAQYGVPVEEGQWYRVSLWARAEGLDGARVSLTLQNTETWRPIFEYQRFSPRAAWLEFSFLVQAGAAAGPRTRFQIWHGHAATLWLADLRVVPCDAPTAGRWCRGLYLDIPEAWDDPYRFFRW